MQINSVYIKQFKSVLAELVVDFSTRTPGVYFVSGENGVGKSTIFDAICWALYGKTIRGSKASDVEPWGKSKTPTCVKVDLDGKEIVRTRNPVQVTYDGDIVEQMDLDRVIGMPYDSFCLSVIIGQLSNMFFDYGPTEKLAILSGVLNLDHWLEMSKRSANNKRQLEEELHDVALQIAHWGSKYQTYKELEKSGDSATEIAKCKTHLDSVRNSLRRGMRYIRTVRRKKTTAITDLRELSEQLDIEMQTVSGHRAQAERQQALLTEEKVMLKAVRAQIKFFENVEDEWEGICPQCQQQVTGKTAAAHVKELEEREGNHTRNVGKIARRLTEANEREASAMKDLEDVRGNITASRKEIAVLTEKIKQKEAQLAAHGEKEKELLDDIETLRDKSKGARALSNKASIAKKHNERKAAALKIRLDAVKYWVKGFKDIRLYVAGSFLYELEVECSNYLDKLDMGDWRISFDIEKLTKAKTVQKGFHTMVYSPTNKDPIPWSSCSGGEAQRLRLAGNMGLSNLLMNRCGMHCNLEVWDEPSSYLSENGVGNLMEAFRSRANDLAKQIWMIDHRTLQFSFDEVLTIVKTSKGTKLQGV